MQNKDVKFELTANTSGFDDAMAGVARRRKRRRPSMGAKVLSLAVEIRKDREHRQAIQRQRATLEGLRNRRRKLAAGAAAA